MNYNVTSTTRFKKDVKRLAKKYQSIKSDIADLAKDLAENPDIGDELFKNCYKVRMAITSKGKGKRGGARIITLVLVQETTVLLLTAYDKSERETINKSEILHLINDLIL